MKVNLHKKAKTIAYAAVVMFMFAAGHSFAQGAGNAMSFMGNYASSPNNVNLGDSLSKAIATTNFTIEMWVKVKSTTSDPVLIGNKNWSNGATTGFAWARKNATSLRFNFKVPGTGNNFLRRDYDMTLDITKWNHIAIVVDRSGMLRGYVNGVQNGTPIDISASAGPSLHVNFPVRLGTDGNSNYTINGDMDELRIWNTVRSELEIRNNMCQKLAGSESGLIAYYKMDESTGTTLINSAAVSSGTHDGVFPIGGSPSRIVSAAAIGDVSANLYGSSFVGQSFNLASTANGHVQLHNIGDSMKGIHLYRVDAVPNTTAGVPNIGTNNVYYGVFAVNDTVNYDVTYDYTNFNNAITYESGIDLFRRFSTDSTWGLFGANKIITNNTMLKAGIRSRNEIIIGNFVNVGTCNPPTQLGAANITINSADLSWTTGGSNRWNLSYNPGAFVPGIGGTNVNNLTASNFSLSGLLPNTTYQFYVQDTCSLLNSASTWAGPFSFTTAINYANYGSGYGLNFQGTSANEHVNLGDSLSGALGTTNFTIETWIKFPTTSADPSFIANKNWASGQNTGFLWCTKNTSNNLRFNFKPSGGTRRDYDFNVPNPSKWNHIVMVVDRTGNLTGYLNGVQIGTPIDISADSGKTLDGTLPLRIGQDGTGTYNLKFKGGMDELRIWNKALTTEEIRTKMCQKLSGAETGILAYYRMDEATGNVLINNALATSTVFSGTLQNGPERIVSGAAIGDTSVYVHPTSWAGTALSLGSNSQGVLRVDSVASNTQGLHIYRVNNIPNYVDGIVDLGTTNQYFGVFTPGNFTSNYRIQYDYSTYPTAVANNNNLHLYSRADNAILSWVQAGATNITVTNIVSQSQNLGTRQYVLADFVAATCPTPTAISITNVDTSSAMVTWNSSASNHTLERGSPNFVLGTGIQSTITTNSITWTDLDASTSYEFYIKDSCSSTQSSVWTGPFTFTTVNPCPQPYNVIADSITTSKVIVKWDDDGTLTQDYLVSWGLQGFGNPAFGIQTNTMDKRFELMGATANTAYDFYLRSNCNSSVSNSGWTGPFTFSTIACDVPVDFTVSAITQTSALVKWSSDAIQHKLEYGPAGFVMGSGTLVGNLTDTAYQLNGLLANTSYEVYVQDSCTADLGISMWAGPWSFTTAAPTGIKHPNASTIDFRVYPNPALDKVMVELPTALKHATVKVKNSMGVLMFEAAMHDNVLNFHTKIWPSGVYFVEVINDGTRSNKKIVVQH